MLKEYATIFRRLMIFADLCIVTFSLYFAYLLRDRVLETYSFLNYLNFTPFFVLIWLILFYFLGMYNSFRIRRIFDILLIISKATLIGFIISVGINYMFKFNVSKNVVVLGFLFSSLLLSLEKVSLISFFRYIRRQGLNYRNVLIVGTGERAQEFVSRIEEHSEWGYRIIGLVDDDAAKKDKTIKGYKVLGLFSDLVDIVHNNVVDEVVFVVPRSWLDRIEPLMLFCESEGLRMHLAVDYFEFKLCHAKPNELHGFPLLTFESAPSKLWHLLIKRVFDFIFSSLVFLFLSPFFIIIATLIKLTSQGPVFFKQERCGLNGRRFILYKFRTMVQDAQERLGKLLSYNEMEGPVFKMKEDPRLTKFGKFLRKLSLDELPQLWNVLKGDMSLIGPRPPLPQEVKEYDYWQRRRLSMKPGLSCLWQIKGRSKITNFNEWMQLDLEYIDNWSLWLDFKIFFKTIPVVLFGRGAH